MKKYHADFHEGKKLQGYEDSDFDNDFQWPNEKMLWVRLIVCVVVGIVLSLGIISGFVILLNKIMEN